MNAGRKPPPDAAAAIPEDDAALFRSAIGTVRPLPEAAALPQRPRPRPAARMARRDEDDARDAFRQSLRSQASGSDVLLSGDALSFRRDQIPARVLQRLRRGDYAAQDELDLHHCDAARAEALLRDFMNHARQADIGCVRIVHGKGLHSDSGVPVVKNLVDRILRQRGDVVAFHSAPPAQGGHGAVLVLLARHRR
jgi:DNA-nicking Smr family endonuclease